MDLRTISIGIVAILSIACSGEEDRDLAVSKGFALSVQEQEPTKPEGPASASERARMVQYLENYAPSDAIVDSYKLGNDWVDCVQIERQFGLRGTGLAKRDIPREPSDAHLRPEPEPRNPDDITPVPVPARQVGERGYGCPEDTVPVIRYTLDELEKYPTLDVWLNRRPKPQSPGDHLYNWRAEVASNIGMTGTLNLWQPANIGSQEFSEMQLWLIGCTMSGTHVCSTPLQSIESGWMSWGGWGATGQPFPDNTTRSFLYTTADGYTTGCWNLECSQFVQTNNLLVIGGPFSNLSTYGGTQYVMPLVWHRDTGADHHWWLEYDGTWIGYYKNNDSWFDSPGLENGAADIEVGAEVVIDSSGTQDMGSGKCPNNYSGGSKFGQVAFVNNIQRNTSLWNYSAPSFTDGTGVVRNDPPFNGMGAVNDPYGSGTFWKTHFFLGGEKSSACVP